MAADVVAWSTAWDESVLGSGGFYRGPSGHAERTFATQVSSGESVARRVTGLASRTLTDLLDEHRLVTVTDVGAGDGTLLGQLMSRLPVEVAERVRWRAVDVRDRPPQLDPRVEWVAADVRDVVSRAPSGPGIVVAHELLDDIPCDVVEIDDDGHRRLVLVEPGTGREELGPLIADRPACRSLGVDPERIDDWCGRWWPRREPAARIEVGFARDDAWSSITRLVDPGLAIAVDYGHVQRQRDDGVFDGGTLAAYRGGRLVSAVPDGTRNLTAHVAIDACAASVRSRTTRLEPSGDGDDFWWLVQAVGR